MTNQPLASVTQSSGAEFAALMDEAKSAENTSLHEILRVQCDLLHLVLRALGVDTPEWRYPRPGQAEPAVTRVSPLDFARRIGA